MRLVTFALAYGVVAVTWSSAALAVPSELTLATLAAPPPPVMPTSDLSPNSGSITFDGKKRLASVWSLREYLDSIRGQDPALYEKLDPELSTLETRRTAAIVIGAGGVVGGMVIVALGIAEVARSGNGVLALIGVCAIGVSALTAYIVFPGNSAVHAWVDHHNELKPDHPLDVRLGFAPTRGGALAGAIVRWW